MFLARCLGMFLKRIVFENIENIILLFFLNYSYYLNLVFFIFLFLNKIILHVIENSF